MKDDASGKEMKNQRVTCALCSCIALSICSTHLSKSLHAAVKDGAADAPPRGPEPRTSSAGFSRWVCFSTRGAGGLSVPVMAPGGGGFAWPLGRSWRNSSSQDVASLGLPSDGGWTNVGRRWVPWACRRELSPTRCSCRGHGIVPSRNSLMGTGWYGVVQNLLGIGQNAENWCKSLIEIR